MAANRFATMVHRNTNKITLNLIYAVLEWILIFLLLLNSAFSYLIIKFAEYFGLKPPCPWCTRLDHVFDPSNQNKKKNMHRDLLCEFHSKEVSRLGYCSNHQKLAESHDMCEDCLSSRPGISKDAAFLPWIKGLGLVQNDVKSKRDEDFEVSLNCSCCGVKLDSDVYSSYILVKPSWDVLECAHKENIIEDAMEFDFDDAHKDDGYNSDKKTSDFAIDSQGVENKDENQMLCEFGKGLNVTEKGIEENGYVSFPMNDLNDELDGGEDEKVQLLMDIEEKKENVLEEKTTLVMEDKSVQVCLEEDASREIASRHLEFFLDYSGHKLVPVELIDLVTEEDQSRGSLNEEVHDKRENQELSLDTDVRVDTEFKLVVEQRKVEVEMEPLIDFDINEKPKLSGLDAMEMEEDENSLVFHSKQYHLGSAGFDQYVIFHLSSTPKQEMGDIQGPLASKEGGDHSDVLPDATQMPNDENESDVSIGTEIPDLGTTDETQNHEVVPVHECPDEDPSTSSVNFPQVPIDGPMVQLRELRFSSFQDDESATNDQPSPHILNEVEEEKVPDTPTSVESLNNLHRKLLLLEKKDSGTEESLDGSVTSELELSDGIVTVERLKTALRAERKALQTLYAELDEERSASAVAASQTMAMINRLQEEKAAMQMEALQYQRMMEEQSEYDQEALQLLNELIVKREKEKQELEKELEVYRKKVLDYEIKEKIRRTKDGSNRSGFSSASCSNSEDSDGLSIDLNEEAKEEDYYSHQDYGNQNTPVDAVLNLEESLGEFEEERLSILEQLKVLEEKLMTLEDDEEQHFENGNHADEDAHFNGEENGHANGFAKEMNGKHDQQRRIAVTKGKSLLPLFDATNNGNGDTTPNGNGNGLDSNGVHDSYDESRFSFESKKNISIEDEVDHLYERLQALEADREFLKHCISSLKKGDKGMDLLQEILQHLRDLRNVEFRVRNMSDGALL